jgi:hypothetical protein
MSTSTTTRLAIPSGAVPSTRGPRWNPAVVILASAAIAVLANLVLWLLGLVAGGSFEFTDDGEVVSAAPEGVVFLSAVPLAAGMGLAWLLSLQWIGVLRLAQVVGSVAAVATIAMTFATDFDTASTVSLSLAHLMLVPIILIGLELIRRRRLASLAGPEG